MDWLSRLATLLEDLREIPYYVPVGLALKAAGKAGARTLGYVVRTQAERIPDRPFLRFEDEALTFGEYNRGVNRYAHALRAAGVQRGHVVAIVMENSPAFLMAEGALAKLGAVGALINTQLRGQALAHVLAASRATVVLVDASCREAVGEVGRIAGQVVYAAGANQPNGADWRDLDEALATADDGEVDIPDVGVEDVALYIYTSGTTGYPKPAIIRHSRLTMGGRALSILLGLREGDCSYAPTPLYHGYSNFVGFAPALYAGTAFASRRRFSVSHFLDDVQRHSVTHFLYVGELCRYLLRHPADARDRQHRMRMATGPGLRPDIWEQFVQRFGIPRIIETYGQTEANVSLLNRRGRVGSVGRAAPFSHRQVRLVRFDYETALPQRTSDGRCIECAPGEVGELLSQVSQQSVMRFDGYVDAAENETKVLHDCFHEGDRWLRTGDLLRRDRSGYYYFVDRVGDTFRWKGENVATAEVAELLNGAPGISETAVYGVRVAHADGRAGMAAVVVAPASSFAPKAFYDAAERLLPAYARPLFVRLITEMDVTATLKHTKRRLQEEGYDLSRVADPLYLRDDEARTYVPYCAELQREIEGGQRRL